MPLLEGTILLALVLGATSTGAATQAPGPSDPPPQATEGPARADKDGSDRPIYLFLNGAADLGDLIRRLSNPDLVVVEWAKYRELRDRAAANAAAPGAGGPVPVTSLEIDGVISGDLADLRIVVAASLPDDGPRRIPLRLDKQILTTVREGDRELRPSEEGGAWHVELRGRGAHRVEVRAKVPVRSTPEGSRLELAIPEAAATSIRLRTDAPATEARLDGKDVVEVRPADEPGGEGGSLIAAHLAPRPRLDLSWKSAGDAGQEGPAVLRAKGKVLVNAERGGIRVRAVYEIWAERGTSKQLAFRLDPADELVSVEVGGRQIAVDAAGRRAGSPVAVALPEPIRVGSSLKLAIATRRELPAEGPSQLVLRGFQLLGVDDQSGLIAVAQEGETWVTGEVGRSLRQVDARSDLPDDMRVSPTNLLAYQFYDQPFELDLQIDPSPPWVRVDSRSTVVLSPRRSRVETLFDYQVSRGRKFEVRVGLPPGLKVDSVGPEKWVESFDRLPEAPGGGEGGGHVLVVRLTQEASESGVFQLRLVGGQEVDPRGRVDLALFRPIDASVAGGKVAVITTRDVSAELEADPHFAAAGGEVPANWAWPEDRPAGSLPPALWLQHDGRSATLPIRGTVRERMVRARTRVDATIERARVDVRQETELRVQFGALSRVDVAVPPAAEGRWEVEGVEVTRREPIGEGPGGTRLHRLFFAREQADLVRLRFRTPIDLGPGLRPDRPSRVEIPEIRPIDVESGPAVVTVSAEPGIRLDPVGPGWEAASATARPQAPALVRRGSGDEAAPAAVDATGPALASLPPLVASRLWLRTTRRPDGSLDCSAWYRVEERGADMSVQLPSGAAWRRVRVGDESVNTVEELPSGAGYRIRFPSRIPAGPVLVALEYQVPSDGSSRWIPPRLLGDASVELTLWEVRIPPGTTLVGNPPGWNDENEWRWDATHWARRPHLSDSGLAAWAAGAGREGPPEVVEGMPRYLFSRAGGPSELRPWLAPRAWVVAAFSGATLAVGLAFLLWRSPWRPVALAIAGALVAVSAAWQPSVFLLGAQSAAVGVVLTALAAITHHLVERRRPAHPPFADPNGMTPRPTPSGLGEPSDLQVGSEGSTVIRPREGTTADHVPTAEVLQARADSGVRSHRP